MQLFVFEKLQLITNAFDFLMLMMIIDSFVCIFAVFLAEKYLLGA